MAYLRTLQPPLQLFSTKPSHHHSLTTTTTTTTMKKSIKALVHTLIIAHLCRAFRALRRVKSILLQAIKDHNFPFSHYLIIYPSSKSKKIHNKNKVFFGSFRLHYNWGSTSSSHVTPVPESVLCGGFNDVVEGLPGYLLWLEEKDREKTYKVSGAGEDDVANEIDRLAEMFIADCHEKFQLEKQESMRRFQEMMARSM